MYQISNEYLKAQTKKCKKLIYQTDGWTYRIPKVPFDFVGRGMKNR
jgi:hypothetical protein